MGSEEDDAVGLAWLRDGLDEMALWAGPSVGLAVEMVCAEWTTAECAVAKLEEQERKKDESARRTRAHEPREHMNDKGAQTDKSARKTRAHKPREHTNQESAQTMRAHEGRERRVRDGVLGWRIVSGLRGCRWYEWLSFVACGQW